MHALVNVFVYSHSNLYMVLGSFDDLRACLVYQFTPVSTSEVLGLQMGHHTHIAFAWGLGMQTLVLKVWGKLFL